MEKEILYIEETLYQELKKVLHKENDYFTEAEFENIRLSKNLTLFC